MNKITFFLLLVIGMISSCTDDDPKSSCINPDVYQIPEFSTVVSSSEELSNDIDSLTYWVCNGGKLTLTGTGNLILVDSGGVVIIEGKQNEAFNLGGGSLTLNGGDNEVWLNGESKTYVYGFENQLYYYRVGQLFEYGDETYIEEICSNVTIDYSKAPVDGCVD
ncbi:MAG: hypothetical protein ACI8YQ_003490 [Polaribacter sp.]|jgi:hypothetical protein